MRRYSWQWLWEDETGGGGSDPQPAQVIPAPPAPDVRETSRESLEAQLWANPQLVAQQVGLQQQYGLPLAQSQADIQARIAPQLARSQFGILSEQAPLFRALLEQQYPALSPLSQQATQGITSPTGLTPAQQVAQDQALAAARGRIPTQLTDALGQQALQQFQSPTGLTPQQQAAQEAIRSRAFEQSERGIRTAANVGGTLYGGRRELREDRARNELAQGFAVQDIDLQRQQRQEALSQLTLAQQFALQGAQTGQQFGLQDVGVQQQGRQQSLQNLISLFQLAGLPVQQFNAPQPTVPGFGQSPVPGGDSLYNALVQNQGNFGIIPGMAGSPGAGPGLAQAGIGAAGMIGAAALIA